MSDDTNIGNNDWLMRILSSIFAALSIMSLLRDFTLVKLHGLVADWLDAYDHLVSSISSALFGWIDWKWMKVDDAEAHGIILASVIYSSILRARIRISGFKSEDTKRMALLAVGALLGGAVMAVSLPNLSDIGLKTDDARDSVFSLLVIIALPIVLLEEDRNEDGFPPTREILKEIPTIIMACALIILLGKI